MSLILDALNRSDSDRSSADVAPGLHSVHGPVAAPPEPTWKKLLWPALALLLAVIALAFWLIERPTPQPFSSQAAPASPLESALDPVVQQKVGQKVEQKVEQVVNREKVPVPAGPAPAARQPSKAAAPASEVAVSDDVAALYNRPVSDSVAEPVQKTATAKVTPGPPGATARAAAKASTAAVSQSGTPTRADSPPDEPSAAQKKLDVEALARAAAALLEEGVTDRAPAVEHSAPFLNALSQRTKDQIPSIFYSSHSWASDPAQRSVILNGEVRREGDQIKPGLRLLEILEDSIVLEFRDLKFRLRSLNSWVNL